MKRQTVVVALALCALAGCGAETMGTAATAASIKQQELQEAQKTLQRANERIGQAIELQQQRADQAGDRN
jgi:TolA-binding protein